MRKGYEQEQKTNDYNKYRQELSPQQFSNCEKYDEFLLKASIFFLSISLAGNSIMSRFIPIQGWAKWAIIISWVFYLLAIASVIISFLISNHSIGKLLEAAEDHLIHKNMTDFEFREIQNSQIKKQWWANVFSGMFFLGGVTFTILFFILGFV